VVIKSKHSISAYGIDGNGNFGLERIVQSRFGNEHTYSANATTVIHPGVTQDVTGISVKLDQDVTSVDDIVFAYRLASDDFRMSEGEETVKGSDVISFMRSKVGAA
jgi:hypothetical protein